MIKFSTQPLRDLALYPAYVVDLSNTSAGLHEHQQTRPGSYARNMYDETRPLRALVETGYACDPNAAISTTQTRAKFPGRFALCTFFEFMKVVSPALSK